MDPLNVAGWGLVYLGIGSVVARVVYSGLCTPACRGGGGNDGAESTAFLSMLLWPVVVMTALTLLCLIPLAPIGRVLATSWKWWLQD